MRQMQRMQGLFVMLLLSGCASGQFAGPLSRMDLRIDQAPMTADTKSYARSFFSRPNPKAFAFSPEKGTAWAAWGSSSERRRKSWRCASARRAPAHLACYLPSTTRSSGSRLGTDGAGPAKPPGTNVAQSGAERHRPRRSDVPPWAERIAVHVASVRNPAEVTGEWQRLTKRYRVLAGLEPQAPLRSMSRARACSTASSGGRSRRDPRRRPCARGFDRREATAQ